MSAPHPKLKDRIGVYPGSSPSALFAYQDATTKTYIEVSPYAWAPSPMYLLNTCGPDRSGENCVCSDLASLVSVADFAAQLLGWSVDQRLNLVKCLVRHLADYEMQIRAAGK